MDSQTTNQDTNQVKEETESVLFQSETSLKQADYDKVSVLLTTLEKNRQMTIQEAMTLTGKARTTAWRYMKILEQANVVISEGDKNNVVYRLSSKY